MLRPLHPCPTDNDVRILLLHKDGLESEGEPVLHRLRKAQSEEPSCADDPARASLRTVAGVLSFCYIHTVASVINLSYKLKLYPSKNKADTLALLSALFRQSHTDATHLLEQGEGRLPSTKSMGEFVGRAYRRAGIDYSRCLSAHRAQVKAATKKAYTDCLLLLNGGKKPKRVKAEQKALAQAAGKSAAEQWAGKFKPPFLKAQLIDSAEIQQPRKATGFDCWIMVRGTTTARGRNGGFYIPARKHRAINRTLALPGATLNESAEVFRSAQGGWYARVSVSVPLPEVKEPKGWLGCDVGARSAVVRSDGYKGPDLRPLFRRDDERKRNHAYQGLERKRSLSPAGQVIAREARKIVSVALQSGRGVALEAPKRLLRWKKHAARLLGYRVLLLAAIYGLAVQEINPAYTSVTCSRCGLVNRHMRHKETFHCWRCGLTVNSDFNAAVNLCHTAYRATAVPHGSLSLLPGGGADE